MTEAALVLESLATYLDSCCRLASKNFKGQSVASLASQEESLNAYPDLRDLQTPQNLICLEDEVDDALIQKAKEAILAGEIFWEHTSAGEATRLALGSKFLIHPHEHLPLNYFADCFPEADIQDEANLIKLLGGHPKDLLSAPLGIRHLAQKIFEIKNLARECGQNPEEILARQKLLLIVSEQNGQPIFDLILKYKHLGFRPENFLFMVQASFHGLAPGADGNFQVSESSAKRLHNHGQMAMQKVMDNEIFYFDPQGQRHYLKAEEFFTLLKSFQDMVSYNIEDLGYLTKALDFETIGLALKLSDLGYRMTMEIVPNDPQNPIKGGLCAYDPHLGRNVMIESYRLFNMKPQDIKHLNKNFNHYPKPFEAFSSLREHGLFMAISVKDNFLYFQPVQGDINFLVNCAFIRRKNDAPIYSWKSKADSPKALRAMMAQDAQKDFAGFFKELLGAF